MPRDTDTESVYFCLSKRGFWGISETRPSGFEMCDCPFCSRIFDLLEMGLFQGRGKGGRGGGGGGGGGGEGRVWGNLCELFFSYFVFVQYFFFHSSPLACCA